jgi:hypothetical protein
MRAPGQKPLQRCSWRCATSTARLEEAVDTFRAALTKRTASACRSAGPGRRTNLGNELQALAVTVLAAMAAICWVSARLRHTIAI